MFPVTSSPRSPGTAPAPHARRSRFYRPELDALRFLAFALIFCDHAPVDNPWFHPIHEIGGFGVSIFFCLSAYLILTLLLRERLHTGTINLRAFAIRRILRILPLYLLTIAVGLLMGLYWAAIHLAPYYLLSLAFMGANIYTAHFKWSGIGCLAPLWSVSVEAQFYLAIPFIARLRKRSIAILCALVTIVAYIALRILGRWLASPVLQVWPNSLVQFQFFAAGAVIALLLFHRTLVLNLIWRTTIGLAGLVLFYLAAMTFGIHSLPSLPTRSLLIGYACELTGTVAIFLSFLHLPLKVPAPMRYLGKISYGLYLFHYPLLWFAFSSDGPLSPATVANRHPVIAVLAVAGVTIALAALSYEFFEKPILRRKQRFEIEKTRI